MAAIPFPAMNVLVNYCYCSDWKKLKQRYFCGLSFHAHIRVRKNRKLAAHLALSDVCVGAQHYIFCVNNNTLNGNLKDNAICQLVFVVL